MKSIWLLITNLWYEEFKGDDRCAIMVSKLGNKIYFFENNENDVEVLFIMESPYIEELNNNSPCMGRSGVVISETLGLGEDAFGKLLLDGMAKRYAVFNTFNFALDTRVCASSSLEKVRDFWEMNEIPWCGLKMQDILIGNKLNCKRCNGLGYNRNAHYKKLWDYIAKIDERIRNNFFGIYISLLDPVIKKEKFNNLKEIVVCGYIAQSIFMEAFGKDNRPFAQRFKVDGFQIPVIFVEHPSHAPNGEWSYPEKIK